MGAVEIQGVDALQNAIKDFDFDLEQAIDDAVRMTAFDVHNKAVNLIRTPSQGRAYKKSKTVTHIASVEGEAPNTDTGRLIGSVSVAHEKGAQLALVGTNLDYGAILETSKNRPWLEPAKNSQIEKFGKRMKQAINNQIKKAKK